MPEDVEAVKEEPKPVTKDKIRTYLLVSAIGMAVLFGSIEIATLQYKVYLHSVS